MAVVPYRRRSSLLMDGPTESGRRHARHPTRSARHGLPAPYRDSKKTEADTYFFWQVIAVWPSTFDQFLKPQNEVAFTVLHSQQQITIRKNRRDLL